MKELSIAEKAKRYDKAFIKSSEFLTLCEKCGAKDTVEFIEDIFPELKMDKESNDERIRKEILDYVNKATGCQRWVAWLEKQCEKPQGKSALDAINEEKVDNQNCVKPSVKGEPKFKKE